MIKIQLMAPCKPQIVTLLMLVVSQSSYTLLLVFFCSFFLCHVFYCISISLEYANKIM